MHSFRETRCTLSMRIDALFQEILHTSSDSSDVRATFMVSHVDLVPYGHPTLVA